MADISEERVSISLLIGHQYIPLHNINSKHDLQVVRESTLISKSLLSGASNIVLASQLDEKELKLFLDQTKNEFPLEYAATNIDEFIKLLQTTRNQGYAISRGERVAGVLCLAAPVKNYTYPVSLNIIGPIHRMEPRLTELIKSLTLSAKHISTNINSDGRKK